MPVSRVRIMYRLWLNLRLSSIATESIIKGIPVVAAFNQLALKPDDSLAIKIQVANITKGSVSLASLETTKDIILELK